MQSDEMGKHRGVSNLHVRVCRVFTQNLMSDQSCEWIFAWLNDELLKSPIQNQPNCLGTIPPPEQVPHFARRLGTVQYLPIPRVS